MKKIGNLLLVLLVVIGGIHTDTLGFSTVSLSANDTKVESIKKAKKLVLGTSADYPPYEFHTVIDNQDTIVGFDIMIAEEIAKELGVELEIKDMSFDGLLAALQTGTIDLVLSGMQATDERRKSVDFSQSYFKDKNQIIVREELYGQYKTLDDLKGIKLGAQQGTTQLMAAEEVKALVPSVNITSVANLLDCIQQVKNGTLDGMVITKTTIDTVLKNDTSVKVLEHIELPAGTEGSAVAVAKGNQDLVAIVDTVLDRLKQEQKIEQFYQEAIELEAQGTSTEQGGDHPFAFVTKYWPLILKGTGITIIVAFFSVVLGSFGGTLLALLKLSKKRLLQGIATVYIDFIRGTPLLIQIYIVFYGLPAIGLKLPAVVAGILAMTINSIAYVAEIIRAGIVGVDKGQFEAAESLGMSKALLMRKIILPQAIKNILPALGNEFITIIKESSVLSIITVTDLMFAANTIRGNTYQPFTPLIVVAIIYFVLTFSLSKGLNLIERKLKKS